MHEFLTENPPTNFKGKMELPLRTVKTLLNELVKIRGESIRDCLVELNISNTALISEFIAMCLMKSHVRPHPLPLIPPHLLHTTTDWPGELLLIPTTKLKQFY